jgi:hypothetical protein
MRTQSRTATFSRRHRPVRLARDRRTISRRLPHMMSFA